MGSFRFWDTGQYYALQTTFTGAIGQSCECGVKSLFNRGRLCHASSRKQPMQTGSRINLSFRLSENDLFWENSAHWKEELVDADKASSRLTSPRCVDPSDPKNEKETKNGKIQRCVLRIQAQKGTYTQRERETERDRERPRKRQRDRVPERESETAALLKGTLVESLCFRA